MDYGSGAHQDYVKSNGHTVIFSMNRQEILSCFYDAALLLRAYPLLQAIDGIDRPGFHFNKDQGFSIQRD